MKRIFSLLIMLSALGPLQGQSVGTWNILTGRARVHKHITLFAEAQLRSTAFYNNFFYYEAKGGINFVIDNHFNVIAGGGRYVTYLDTGNFELPYVAREWRIWQEFGMKQEIYRLFFEHRYRIEERFFTNGFRMRFRYRLSLLVPLNHSDFRPNTLYLVGAEEIFLTNKAPYFERNRLFLGAGFRMKLITVQTGWMNQFDYKLSGSKTRNFFQIQALFDLDFTKGNGKHTVPSQID